MAYTKQTWADLPSKTTPINAERLTHIEDGIFNAAATADNAASAAGTAAANVGIVSGKVETLTERVNGLDTAVSNKVDKEPNKGLSTNDYTNTDKAKVDALGTASTKNSTSVVTQSTDLVESGAVYDALGFGNKNLLDPSGLTTNGDMRYTPIYVGNTDVTLSTSAPLSLNASVLFLIAGNVQSGALTVDNGVSVNNPRTVTAVNGYVTVASRELFDVDIRDYNSQLEKGSTATAYEPYHASVSDSLEEKADNSVIGTVEDGANPTKSYEVGEHMIRGGKFCTVTVPVTTSSTWTLGGNYIEGDVADLLKTEIGSFNTPATNVTLGITTYMKYGNVMNVRLTFTASEEIARATDICKCPYGRAGSYNQYLTSLNGKVFYLTAAGTIRNDEVLQAGSYTVIGTVMV